MTSNNSPPISRTSAFVSSFLRIVLIPIIILGLPSWPLLLILSFVPVLGVLAFPLLLSLSVILFYSIPWFSYLLLAQSSPPSSLHSNPYLPFLPYSPRRCAKVNWVALQYCWTALSIGFPAVFDWCYRRVMMLGTQGGGGVVKEGILYGSPYPSKRLDIYLPSTRDRIPPSSSTSPYATMKSRTRKHSTLFAEDFDPTMDPSSSGNDEGHGFGGAPVQNERLAPVVVFLPSVIPPITWTSKRKTYLQLALRLRRMGFCVVVPDITYFPEARISASITDLRLVLRWTALNCARYGGDPNKIHLMSHGLGSHLAMLTITQEAVVLSREGWLESERMKSENFGDRRQDFHHQHNQSTYQQQREREEMVRWDREGGGGGEHDDEEEELKLGGGPPAPSTSASPNTRMKPKNGKLSYRNQGYAQSSGRSQEPGSGADEWVDEVESYETEEEELPPGQVMSSRAARGAEARVRKQMEALEDEEGEELGDGSASTLRAGGGNIHRRSGNSGINRSAGGGPGIAFPSSTSSSSYQNHQSGSSVNSNQTATAPISNGLLRVNLVSPEIEIPPLAGMILIAGVSDVIKGYRHESERGIETLSSLRRAVGPGHTSCLLHSPAHLLYAAKNILDVGLLPPKFLLIHGGKDSVVPIEQSTLMKTLLTGVGLDHVKLRAYRELGHLESVASLFLGIKNKYSKQILNDVKDFVSNA